MDNKSLNVVYIGAPSFPAGGATTKRRRYMVDYMNNHGIQSHYLVCDFKQRDKRLNDISGRYGLCDYIDITQLAADKKYLRFWNEGKKQLKAWYVDSRQNILIFTTILSLFEYPLYTYAIKLGYKVVFDQVETSFLQRGYVSKIRRLKIIVSYWQSNKTNMRNATFFISKNLWKENQTKYPQRQICLLPNSTPQLCSTPRKTLNAPLRILYAGTFAPKDGVKFLLEGVIRAFENGCPLELILLGKGIPQDMKVLEIAKGKGYIKYAGFVSDDELNRYLLSCDVLCMTRINSRFANFGFPFKLSEYLATGNIVLATNVGDVCDYLVDKVSAYIVPPEDNQAIADTLCHIASHHQEALVVAEGGLKAMQQYFSIDVVGATFVDFLKRL